MRGEGPEYFYVFSYGSNMLIKRIRKRVPSVVAVQTHRLSGFELTFNKASKDGSTKANLIPSKNGSSSHGIIQRLDWNEKSTLDRAEGLGYGYSLRSFQTDIRGTRQEVHYYIAHEKSYLKGGKPYDWYLEYVLYGAVESDLPESYIDNISVIPHTVDNDGDRRKEHDEVLKEYRKAYKNETRKFGKPGTTGNKML